MTESNAKSALLRIVASAEAFAFSDDLVIHGEVVGHNSFRHEIRNMIDDSETGDLVLSLKDEDNWRCGHVSRAFGMWWRSLSRTQRDWITSNGQVDHCHGRICGIEVTVKVG